MRSELYLPKLPKTYLLTDTAAERILGPAYGNSLIYNFDFHRWNRDTYLNFPLGPRESDTHTMWHMKYALEQSPWLTDYEIVACVSMVVGDNQIPLNGTAIETPHFNAMGTAVVSNLILRHRTDLTLSMPPCWQCAHVYGCRRTAATMAGHIWPQRMLHGGFQRQFAELQRWTRQKA
ncbi:hypothetical protein HDR63_02555 [bacterium]|nr:hypothetical protein [bacterium]